MKRIYSVLVPIAGHAHVTVEADDEESAIDLAMQEVTTDHLEDWEALRRFNQGNVCYCPSPWEVEVVDETPDDQSEEA